MSKGSLMHTALLPGTYDPITLGHLDVIRRTSQIFDALIIGVADLQKKGSSPLFSIEERVAFVQDAVSTLENVTVQAFSTLLVDFSVQVGAQTIVKGLRAITDFESEFQQASLNYRLNPNLETMFIMATPEHMYLSSSAVKEVASLHGDIRHWVTPMVYKALIKHFS